MREILFRGKRVDNGEWVFGDLVQIPRAKYRDKPEKWFYDIWEITATAHRQSVQYSTIGQSTGLTDKNGVKIFEGDIVAIPPFMSRKETFGVVKFGDYKNSPHGVDDTNRGFYIHWRYDDNEAVENLMRRDIVFWCKYSHVDIEVIGNIHDNPELLGGDY